MRLRKLNPPVIGAIAGTRALLGFGAGLLMSPRMSKVKRRRLGWAMVGVGAVTTVPLAMTVWKNS